jgi:hypothetical protein
MNLSGLCFCWFILCSVCVVALCVSVEAELCCWQPAITRVGSTHCHRRKGQHSGRSEYQSLLSTCVLFQTVPEVQLFHRTVPKLLIRKIYAVV